MKVTKLCLYILLLIYCFSITLPVQSSQVEELGRVLAAQISWNDAQIHVTNLAENKAL